MLQTNQLSHTPLYLAAALGHLNIVSTLLRHGAEVNVACGHYGSPLHAACFAGHIEVVDVLLRHGASLTCGPTFQNALEAAFRGDREDAVIRLLQDDSVAQSTVCCDQVMLGAAQAGFLRAIQLIQQFVPASRVKGAGKAETKIAKAIESGHIDVLRWFINQNSDPMRLLPEDSVTIATLHGHGGLVEFLLDIGMNIEAEGVFGSPLRTAFLLNRLPIVQILLGRGANINACGSMGDALHIASSKGYTSILGVLIQEGADVNHHTGFYGNVLQAAAYHGHLPAVVLLLDAGADVHAPGYSKDMFHAATEAGHPDIVILMLNRGYAPYFPISGVGHYIAPPSRYKALLRSPSPGHDNHPSRGKYSREGYPTTPPVSKFGPVAGFDTIFEPARHSENHKTHALLEGGNQRPDIGRYSLLEVHASLVEDFAGGFTLVKWIS